MLNAVKILKNHRLVHVYQDHLTNGLEEPLESSVLLDAVPACESAEPGAGVVPLEGSLCPAELCELGGGIEGNISVCDKAKVDN